MQSRVWNITNFVWKWTFGALPEILTSPGLIRKWSQEVRIDKLPFAAAGMSRGSAYDLVLSQHLFLKKDFTLPRAAKADLKNIIDLKVQQSSPSKGLGLVWHFFVLEQRKSEIVVRVYLIKESTLRQLIGAVENAGALVRTIGISGKSRSEPIFDNRQKIDRVRRAWSGLSISLLAAIVCLLVWKERQETSYLQKHSETLQNQKHELANQLEGLRTKANAENVSILEIDRKVGLFIQEHKRLPILIDLTSTLPEDTWISEFSIVGDELYLSGFSETEVTAIIANIQNFPWAKSVELEGAVSFDSYTRKNRFDLLVSIAEVPE